MSTKTRQPRITAQTTPNEAGEVLMWVWNGHSYNTRWIKKAKADRILQTEQIRIAISNV